MFQVEAEESLESYCSLYHLPIEHGEVQKKLECLGACWTHVFEAREAGSATLLAANDLIILTLEDMFSCRLSKEFWEAWGSIDSTVAQGKFMAVAKEVMRDGNKYAKACYLEGAIVYGLTEDLALTLFSDIYIE